MSRQHVCFSSNVFGVRTLLALPFREVVSVSKGTQSLINPSIVIMTKSDQHIFASFWKRDNVSSSGSSTGSSSTSGSSSGSSSY